jgi:hypothetical protein
VGAPFKLFRGYAKQEQMEKIDPQGDHEWLSRFKPGQQVQFQGK